MTIQDNSNARDYEGRKRLLRCEKYGASSVTLLHDLVRHTQQGWPKCCGDMMALFVEEPTATTATHECPTNAPTRQQ